MGDGGINKENQYWASIMLTLDHHLNALLSQSPQTGSQQSLPCQHGLRNWLFQVSSICYFPRKWHCSLWSSKEQEKGCFQQKEIQTRTNKKNKKNWRCWLNLEWCITEKGGQYFQKDGGINTENTTAAVVASGRPPNHASNTSQVTWWSCQLQRGSVIYFTESDKHRKYKRSAC